MTAEPINITTALSEAEAVAIITALSPVPTTNHAARLADQLDRLARQDGRLHPHEIAACRDASRILRPTDDPEYRRAVDAERTWSSAHTLDCPARVVDALPASCGCHVENTP